jgi:thiol-disulfide isomerase/thioredoxin
MILRIATLIITTILAGCAPATVSYDENQAGLAFALGEEFTTVSGEQMRLADFSGQIVLLHFLSPTCPACEQEAPSLKRLHDSFKDSRFSVVGVSARGSDPYSVHSFALRNGLGFPILLDTEGSLEQFFSISQLPSSIFLNRDGVPLQIEDPSSGEVTSVISGARAWDTEGPIEMVASIVEGM